MNERAACSMKGGGGYTGFWVWGDGSPTDRAWWSWDGLEKEAFAWGE